MGEPIEVFNRYTGELEREPVYGERWLRWTYETALGHAALIPLVRRVWFSRWYGRRMDHPKSVRLVDPFIARYGIDTTEFAQPPPNFRTFNEFFIRRLKAAVRPVCEESAAVVFPADGRHLGFSDISSTSRIYAKGREFDLARLLADRNLARKFNNGTVVVSRLCPIDYHRFHFPCAGHANRPRLINGTLSSVSPIALRRSLGILCENKRYVTVIESSRFGSVIMVEIGATCVGSIVHTVSEGEMTKGQEKGCFRFGGSCVVTLFEAGRVDLDDDLLVNSRAGIELYAHFGDRMGTAQ